MTQRFGSGLFVTALVVAACAAPPHGHGDGCPEPVAMRQQPGASPAAMAEQHLAALKPQLNLTPEQEKSWDTLLASIRESDKGMQTARAEGRRPTPGEIEGVRIAADRFYASLSADQREIMDRNMPRPPPPCLDSGPPPAMIYGKPPAKPVQ